MNNFEMVRLAESFLGKYGAIFRRWAGLGSGDPWCNAFVSYLFAKSDNEDLYCDGRKEVSCPHSIKWCYANLALLPIYIVMPGDVVYFDWEPNNIPNHVGIVKERISDLKVSTIEGNTSGSKVAQRERSRSEVQGVFRPHFHVDESMYSSTKELEIDSYFGYSTIAVMQRWLGVTIDAILGQQTVKALQRKLSLEQDGWWGPNTTRAVQRLIGTEVDGYFGPKSVMAFQRYLNKAAFGKTNAEVNIPASTTKTIGEKIAESAKSYIGKVKYVKGGTSLKTGCDCTGFVRAIYGLHGFTLKAKLSTWGKSIGTDVSKAKAGDIFTYKDSTGIHHGIYVGSGMVVHAANVKEGVKKSKWNSMSRPLVGIRRRWA